MTDVRRIGRQVAGPDARGRCSVVGAPQRARSGTAHRARRRRSSRRRPCRHPSCAERSFTEESSNCGRDLTGALRTVPLITTTEIPTTEKTDLLGALAKHRYLFRYTVQGLTDEQARLTPTASELSLGGLIKHVTDCERAWVEFIQAGAVSMEFTEDSFAERENGFRMLPGETLEGLLAEYSRIAARTEEVVAALPSLDLAHDLPEAPWFTEKAWSARRVLTHLVAETAQHAGHADILRETIDGQKSMG